MIRCHCWYTTQQHLSFVFNPYVTEQWHFCMRAVLYSGYLSGILLVRDSNQQPFNHKHASLTITPPMSQALLQHRLLCMSIRVDREVPVIFSAIRTICWWDLWSEALQFFTRLWCSSDGYSIDIHKNWGHLALVGWATAVLSWSGRCCWSRRGLLTYMPCGTWRHLIFVVFW